MLLSGALFALFMMGFWLYCLTDAMVTPASEYRGLSKPAWIAVIALTFVGGAIAWLIAREPLRRGLELSHRVGADLVAGRAHVELVMLPFGLALHTNARGVARVE